MVSPDTESMLIWLGMQTWVVVVGLLACLFSSLTVNGHHLLYTKNHGALRWGLP